MTVPPATVSSLVEELRMFVRDWNTRLAYVAGELAELDLEVTPRLYAEIGADLAVRAGVIGAGGLNFGKPIRVDHHLTITTNTRKP